MQIVSVDFTVAPENIQRALDQFGHTAAEVRQMAGALRYDIYADPRGNGSVLIYQNWSSPADFAVYQASPSKQALLSSLKPLMIAPPLTKIYAAELTA
ncbi:putative quinol monooxygenase [Rhizobium arsenicireducens]|jgi:quinol monooxygenase YgiN